MEIIETYKKEIKTRWYFLGIFLVFILMWILGSVFDEFHKSYQDKWAMEEKNKKCLEEQDREVKKLKTKHLKTKIKNDNK